MMPRWLGLTFIAAFFVFGIPTTSNGIIYPYRPTSTRRNVFWQGKDDTEPQFTDDTEKEYTVNPTSQGHDADPSAGDVGLNVPAEQSAS
jgi:hypothetical protein